MTETMRLAYKYKLRPTRKQEQAIFKCVKCGYIVNADDNAAHNILKRAGQDLPACQANLVGGRHQEPAEAYNNSTIVV